MAVSSKGAAPLSPIYVVKTRPAVSEGLSGLRDLLIPPAFAPAPPEGTRILLREFNGGLTGRFDVVRFIEVVGTSWKVSRTWARTKTEGDDTDLRFVESLGYEVKHVEGILG